MVDCFAKVLWALEKCAAFIKLPIATLSFWFFVERKTYFICESYISQNKKKKDLDLICCFNILFQFVFFFFLFSLSCLVKQKHSGFEINKLRGKKNIDLFPLCRDLSLFHIRVFFLIRCVCVCVSWIFSSFAFCLLFSHSYLYSYSYDYF